MEVPPPIGGPTSWRYFFIPSGVITILDYIKNYLDVLEDAILLPTHGQYILMLFCIIVLTYSVDIKISILHFCLCFVHLTIYMIMCHTCIYI